MITDNTPGIISTLQCLEQTYLRKLFERQLPHIAGTINWEQSARERLEQIRESLANRTLVDEKSRDRFYALLHDINLLSQRARDVKYYKDQIVKFHYAEKFVSDHGTITPPIQSVVIWIWLEAPKLWTMLLQKRMREATGLLGGRKYYLPTNVSTTPRESWLSDFKAAFKQFVKEEHGLDVRVHVDRDEFRNYFRYTIMFDPLPKNVPTFVTKDQDTLGTKLSDVLECIYVCHYKKNNILTFRGPGTESQRDRIILDFCKTLFNTKTISKPKQCRKLDGFRSRPKEFNLSSEEDFVSKRYAGLRIEFNNGNMEPEVYCRILPRGNFYDDKRVQQDLEEMPESLRTVSEIYLDLTIKTGERLESYQDTFWEGLEDPRPSKTFRLIVKPGGFIAKPHPSEVDEIKIERILKKMGLGDTNSDSTLEQVLRHE